MKFNVLHRIVHCWHFVLLLFMTRNKIKKIFCEKNTQTNEPESHFCFFFVRDAAAVCPSLIRKSQVSSKSIICSMWPTSKTSVYMHIYFAWETWLDAREKCWWHWHYDNTFTCLFFCIFVYCIRIQQHYTMNFLSFHQKKK